MKEMVEVTAEQIAAFHEKLDSYDTATVQALMDNETAIDAVRHRREVLDPSAYRPPDGRPVLKTEDGKHVFDRNGSELSHDIVHPDIIPDTAPRWEAVKREKDTEDKLTRERQDLHSFQQRLDEARETVDKGHVSADALSKMDAALLRDMPNAVRSRLTGTAAQPEVSRVEIPAPSLLSKSALELRIAPAGL